MEQVVEVPSQEAVTRDNVGVRIDAAVFHQVPEAARASYGVSNLDQAPLTLTMTNIRAVVGSMDLDRLLSRRDEINERLLGVMDAAASPWGGKMTRIEIKDILPPADLAGAMARQTKAEREKRASVLEAERQRHTEILRAKGREQAAILQAEARERLAEAEAKATGLVSAAIAQGRPRGSQLPGRRKVGRGGEGHRHRAEPAGGGAALRAACGRRRGRRDPPRPGRPPPDRS